MHIGDFINGLDCQQRRVHIHRHQAKFPQRNHRVHESKIELGFGAIFSDMFPSACIFQPESLTGDAVDLVRASKLRQLAQIPVFDFQSLDDEIHMLFKFL